MTGPTLDRSRLRSLFDLRGDAYASRGGTFAMDPYPTFHRLRESGPVHAGAPHEALGWTGDVFFQGLPYPDRPHFSAYDFATCQRVLQDDEHFVTKVPALDGEPDLPDAAILYMDHRRHRDYRKLVQPSFVPGKAIWWLDNWIRTIVDDLVSSLAEESTADLNAEFCAPIPLLTITGSFGITVEQALDVRAAVVSDGQDVGVLARLLVPIVAARRATPEDDLISVLVQAELVDEDGALHRLTDAEVLAFAFLLLAAGSGTTWKQLGITINALLAHPQALAAARADAGFLRQVTEESLRWTPTDPVFARFCAKDTELGGVTIPAGAVVHACLAAGNRDPLRWSDPDVFDPFRPAKGHLGFGYGPHTCLGAHVARVEIRHGIAALLDHFPGLAADGDAPAPRVIGLYERGPDRVPVRLKEQR